jgi:hypothetical protein
MSAAVIVANLLAFLGAFSGNKCRLVPECVIHSNGSLIGISERHGFIMTPLAASELEEDQ